MTLEVAGVEVVLGGRTIVDDLALRVADGQFVGLIGPNGCGKSTLLKAIYKVLKPQKGTIALDQLDVLHADARTVARHSAVVGQFQDMNFDLTVWDMVALGRTPHKKLLELDTPEDARIVTEALRTVNLEAAHGRKFLSLSGGEKQRVVLARAIAQQPRFLILDEPTNHLDVRYQLQVLNVVKNLGISTLAALHDLGLAAQYCDYLYAMKDGRVVAQGRPEDVLVKPTLEAIYDIRCEVYRNPVTGTLAVAYLA